MHPEQRQDCEPVETGGPQADVQQAPAAIPGLATACPACGAGFRLEQGALGRPSRCPFCEARFVVRAAPGAKEVLSHESIELRWVAPDELASLETDGSVQRLFDLTFGA